MISVDNEFISTTIKFKKKYNLKKLLTELNNPQNNFKVINVVGTNGKGSVSHYTSILLKEKYKKVGLFISPAFLYHNERIQINNNFISDKDLKRIYEENINNINKYKLSFFEIWTLICIIYFSENKIDIAVVEAGIGGRKDSTNIFENQIITCLTSVSIDHQEVLGNSIKKIIKQKIGILKTNSILINSNSNLKYSKYINKKIKGEMIQAKNFNSSKFNDEYFQEENKGIVYEISKLLEINYKEQLEKLEPPLGRVTILNKKPIFMIDGCHNIDSIKKFISNVSGIEDSIFLYASSYAKNHNEILNFLLEELNKKIYICNFNHIKSWEADKSNKNYIKDWKSFLKKMIKQEKNIFVFGSLYFIPQVYDWYKRRNNYE